MHFAHEILDASDLSTAPDKAVTDKELKMAQALIESMSMPWEPEKYRDEYRTAMMELIELKAQNKEVGTPPAPSRAATNVVDLVKVLQESLSRTQTGKPKATATRRARSTSSLVRQRRRVAA